MLQKGNTRPIMWMISKIWCSLYASTPTSVQFLADRCGGDASRRGIEPPNRSTLSSQALASDNVAALPFWATGRFYHYNVLPSGRSASTLSLHLTICAESDRSSLSRQARGSKPCLTTTVHAINKYG